MLGWLHAAAPPGGKLLPIAQAQQAALYSCGWGRAELARLVACDSTAGSKLLPIAQAQHAALYSCGWG